MASKDILLDHTHCTGSAGNRGQQAPDILTCLHYFRQKEAIMEAARGLGQITFEGHKLALYQDLAVLTLQKRQDFRPITEFLAKKQVSYRWGHLFRLIFTW